MKKNYRIGYFGRQKIFAGSCLLIYILNISIIPFDNFPLDSKLDYKLEEANEKPNVLFISVDDLNDWVGYLGGYPGKVYTPNLDRLSNKGIAFTNAHVPAPVCNPSRTAILTGLFPTTTGVYGNYQVWNTFFQDIETIPRYFKNHSYYVGGCGKIFHQPLGFNPPQQWHKYLDLVRDDPWNEHFSIKHCKVNCNLCQTVFGKYLQKFDSVDCAGEVPDWFPKSGMPVDEKNLNFDWGGLDLDDLEMGDGRTIQWAEEFLTKKYSDPFFLAVGIFRPHQPWYFPKKYLDLYPLSTIVSPLILENDLDDVPQIAKTIAHSHTSDYKLILAQNKYKEAIRGYLASISYADAMVGRLLNTLDETPYADNTIIVLWSDHGWHLGEKSAWKKNTLWEESTRVPFIIYDPRIQANGSKCNRAVEVIDIFPTLIELCGLPEKKELDGISLVSLMYNPSSEWNRPALTTRSKGNSALRDERWRYIRYSDGSEELYDHSVDPNEWNNLVHLATYQDTIKYFRNFLPQKEATPIKNMDMYEFNFLDYQWYER